MSRLQAALLIVFAVLIWQAVISKLEASPPVGASGTAGPYHCNGKYKGGLKPSPDELMDILKKNETAGTQLSLGLHLNKPNLCEANLYQADLTRADLTGAELTRANLQGAYLQNAHLERAKLAGAYLNGAYLAHADLAGANVEGADFDLLPDSLPYAFRLSSSAGLQFVKFEWEPSGLVNLRSQFRGLGLRTQENQLTYAIMRSELRRTDGNGVPLHGRVERLVNYVFLDFTCRYGMSPERPVFIVAFFSVLFTCIYVFGQIVSGQRDGIWAVWDEHRIDKTEGSDIPQRLTEGFPSARDRGPVLRFFNRLLLAIYFSILSALRIGWSGLNFSTWISRMQPREYTLHATGWVRVVSGLQSLISVYLVALTILTYFGTPFEY